ncbi:glycoside hydrolase family 57 protein [Desulfuromonas sp. AOP6]|uniref:glycoside hydrolase family 57 protein n=1 Tax=Desulfuromonas sp. AOP6 TaxID=1566351 RepID=UPI00126FD691|nr:glycoside hydrolase family 57 protein [Desulfuromonas sp. AOP6]BCA78645.1 glycoside hydrolase [Desulfuromonas sp. AOP6]
MPQLNVALIWHMHQPDYRDPVSGRILMPWTYLHAVKDYGEMLKTAREFPGARMTFNLVPTLVEQLERYATGEADDQWLEAARKDPRQMDTDERRFVLTQFFSVHGERHILPYPRYRQLAQKRGSTRLAASPEMFSDQELRDLQVWFLLAWSGHHLRREQAFIPYLLEKGENFSEQDKLQLLDLYDEEVAGVIELYRQMEQAGLIEISVTPYAHPILPLLCQTAIAREATPGIQLPGATFRHPEDARLQVRYGLDFIARRLGKRPRGMWPSEGAVSAEVLRILKEEGVLWAASDEGILAKSLDEGIDLGEALYAPSRFEELPLLFRDRELSDRIGFVYAHWEPERAAADLTGHLKNLARKHPGGVVALILDGENCWERYQDNGYPFLSALYSRLQQEPSLRMTTVSEAIASSPGRPLSRLAPGSWINSDFSIWIGHAEENTAWEWLERARRDTLGDQTPVDWEANNLPEKALHLLRAEGSDWFWWYGDDHSTEQADLFDRLFRRHLEAVYRADGQTVPQHLHSVIKPLHRKGLVHEPTALFTPVIDGRVNDYFEWLAAGAADLSAGGAMHASHRQFSMLLFGYDRKHLYLRLDPQEHLPSLIGACGYLEIRLAGQEDWIARLDPLQQTLTLQRPGEEAIAAEGEGACDHIVEMAIPLAPLKLATGKALNLSIHLLVDNEETARWPAEGPLTLQYRGEELDADEWYV